MEKVSNGIRCITTSTAIVPALNTLNANKVAVATPYIEEINKKGRIFLEDKGFYVKNVVGLDLLYDLEIDSQSLETVYKLAKKANTKDAHIVITLCTGIRSIGILEYLEKDLGKPVISANQATFWYSFRAIGIEEKVEGYGSLLEKY